MFCCLKRANDLLWVDDVWLGEGELGLGVVDNRIGGVVDFDAFVDDRTK